MLADGAARPSLPCMPTSAHLCSTSVRPGASPSSVAGAGPGPVSVPVSGQVSAQVSAQVWAQVWAQVSAQVPVPPQCSIAVMPRIGYSVVVSEERMFIAVQSRGLIAIPTSIRRHLGLDQPGAQVEVIERGGEIVLRPHVAVPTDQAWFWSERWQQREMEADEAIRTGRVTAVEGVEEMLVELES